MSLVVAAGFALLYFPAVPGGSIFTTEGMIEMSDSKSSDGVSIVGLLGVAFVVLKLCDVIDWSWWWVTAPFWGPALLFLVVLAIAGGIWVVAKLIE